jgi:hypothetical protein
LQLAASAFFVVRTRFCVTVHFILLPALDIFKVKSFAFVLSAAPESNFSPGTAQDVIINIILL